MGEKKLDNLITILTAEDKLDLPIKNLDFIFMRNIAHHLSNRMKYFKNLKNFDTSLVGYPHPLSCFTAVQVLFRYLEKILQH